MVEFTADLDGGVKLLGIGLSKNNLAMLMKGKPIQIECEKMGVPNQQVLIFYGDTEESMTKDLIAQGLITDDTNIHLEKRGTNRKATTETSP